MQVTKLRASAGATGLVPAGRYFEQLAQTLRASNAREQRRNAQGDTEDPELVGPGRRASAARPALFELVG